LRASVLADPAFSRRNTKDNTPAVVNIEIVKGDTVDVIVAAKGGGSEAKSKFAMLNPSDSVADWVLKTVPTMGAGWCPPGMLGIGIGGTAEKAMLLAKAALMEPIDMQELIARRPQNKIEELRIDLYRKGECAWDWSAGARRADYSVGCQDSGLSDPCRESACGDDSKLCRYPSCSFSSGW